MEILPFWYFSFPLFFSISAMSEVSKPADRTDDVAKNRDESSDPGLSQDERKNLDNRLKPFQLDDVMLEKFIDALTKDLLLGLSAASNSVADLKCFPTYVSKLPSGREKGRYLALDLGGTNFRVLLVDLEAASIEEQMKMKTYEVPEHVRVGSAAALFDHVAACTAEFVVDEKLQESRLPLGFTFSFPCQQRSLNCAILQSWSKGFKCDDALGQDVAKLFMEAVRRRDDTLVDCVAVLNDTTGTLMSCAYNEPETAVGLILGTGTNACYLEKLDQIELWKRDERDAGQEYGIVNTEWCAFGTGGCLDRIGLRTDVDRRLDASFNPGHHLFEKMVSGKFLGEIARLILCDLHADGFIFRRQDSFVLDKDSKFGAEKFETKFLSDVEADDPKDMSHTRRILDEIGIRCPTRRDCEVTRIVCQTVASRSAKLSGAATACLLRRMNRKSVTVAVDGSVYRFHPTFHDEIVKTIRSLVPPDILFRLVLSTDGSGRGAALVAAAATNENK